MPNNNIRITIDTEALKQAAVAFDGMAKTAAEMVDEYQRIGGVLVRLGDIATIVRELIDDYTDDKLQRTGELISPDLLAFRDWVAQRYEVNHAHRP